MIARHLSVAALLVAGVASLAVLGNGSDPATGQASDLASAPKTRVTIPAGDTTRVEAALAAGASAFVPVPAYRMYDSRADPVGKFIEGEIAAIDALTDMDLIPQIPADATGVTFNVTVT